MYLRKYLRFPKQLSLRTPVDSRHSIQLDSEFHQNENTTLSQRRYLEPSQTSKMELFTKINNSSKPLTFSAKSSILDILLGPENVSGFTL